MTTQRLKHNSPYLPHDPLTVVEAAVQVPTGDALYIRGEGEGLSWEKGQPLKRGFRGSWIWSSSEASGKVLFKLLVNDRVWARGDRLEVAAGKLIAVAPEF